MWTLCFETNFISIIVENVSINSHEYDFVGIKLLDGHVLSRRVITSRALEFRRMEAVSDWASGTPGDSGGGGGYKNNYYINQLMFLGKTLDNVGRSDWITRDGLACQSDPELRPLVLICFATIYSSSALYFLFNGPPCGIRNLLIFMNLFANKRESLSHRRESWRRHRDLFRQNCVRIGACWMFGPTMEPLINYAYWL